MSPPGLTEGPFSDTRSPSATAPCPIAVAGPVLIASIITAAWSKARVAAVYSSVLARLPSPCRYSGTATVAPNPLHRIQRLLRTAARMFQDSQAGPESERAVHRPG